VTAEDKTHVRRLFGPPTPEPVAGCSECAQLAEARAELAARHDRSAVSDANVAMRDHLARRH